MEKLEESIKVYNAKIVIISDIAGAFLDSDVPLEEAQNVYNQILSYLSNFAKKYKIIVIATYLPYERSRRNSSLQEMTFTKADVLLEFTKTPYTREVSLEKHPFLMLGTAELPSENLTLTDFMNTTQR